MIQCWIPHSLYSWKMSFRNEGLWDPWLQKIPLLSAQGDLGMMAAVLIIILTRVPMRQKQNDSLW